MTIISNDIHYTNHTYGRQSESNNQPSPVMVRSSTDRSATVNGFIADKRFHLKVASFLSAQWLAVLHLLICYNGGVFVWQRQFTATKRLLRTSYCRTTRKAQTNAAHEIRHFLFFLHHVVNNGVIAIMRGLRVAFRKRKITVNGTFHLNQMNYNDNVSH